MREMPLALRMMEGLTTNMLLGYWYAGGEIVSPLSLVYMLHWMASFRHHVNPSHQNFLIDTHFIDMLNMERVFAITGTHYVYPVYLLTMWMNQHHPFVCYCKVALAVLMLYLWGKTSIIYLLVWCNGGVLYLLSDYLFYRSMLYWKVMVHVVFHISMTLASVIEKNFYQYDQAPLDWLRLVVFLIYLYQGLIYLKK